MNRSDLYRLRDQKAYQIRKTIRFELWARVMTVTLHAHKFVKRYVVLFRCARILQFTLQIVRYHFECKQERVVVCACAHNLWAKKTQSEWDENDFDGIKERPGRVANIHVVYDVATHIVRDHQTKFDIIVTRGECTQLNRPFCIDRRCANAVLTHGPHNDNYYTIL